MSEPRQRAFYGDDGVDDAAPDVIATLRAQVGEECTEEFIQVENYLKTICGPIAIEAMIAMSIDPWTGDAWVN
jgi:hypothetical protein